MVWGNITPETRIGAHGPENMDEKLARWREEAEAANQVEPYDTIWCVQLIGFAERGEFPITPEEVEWFRRVEDAMRLAIQSEVRVKKSLEHYAHILVWRYERESDWAPILERQVL